MRRRGLHESFGWAIKGIVYSLKQGRNMRIHGVVGSAVILYSLHMRLNPSEFCIILICVCLVIVTEMLNTSVEYLIDITVGLKMDYLAGLTKDISAGAVLFSAVTAAICGFVILGPKVVPLLDVDRIGSSAVFGICLASISFILRRKLNKIISPDIWRTSLFFLFFPFLLCSSDIWLPFLLLSIALFLSFENIAFGRAMAKGVLLEAILGLSAGLVSVLV